MQGINRTAIVSGSTSGIGLALATLLLQKGWKVVLVALRPDELNRTKTQLQKQIPGAEVETHAADLSLNRSRKMLADSLLQKHQQIHLLVNNAGGIFSEYELNEDGIERTFALNHLGYFHLSLLLLPLLKNAPEASILNVTSRNHFEGEIDFGLIMGQHNRSLATDFKHWLNRPLKQKVLYAAFGKQAIGAYSQSKLANVLFTQALAQKLKGTCVTVNCLHPGMVKTNIAASVKPVFPRLFWKLVMHIKAITPAESANYIMDALSQIESKKLSGVYFELNRIAIPYFLVNDEYLQDLLWDKSVKWCGL